MNTGLLILSRYPIHESEVLVFSHQFIGEQFAVNRGAMYAKIVRPGYSPLHFFTAHVSPSMRKLLQGYPEPLLNTVDISINNLIENYQMNLNFYLAQSDT